MESEEPEQAQQQKAQWAESIAKKSRKIGMLVNRQRHPEAKEKIRADYKRQEKLTALRKNLSKKRNRPQ